MKKFFIVLGSIFLAILVLGAIGIAFVAVRGNALDKESKAYADAAIPAIVTGWNEKELLDRASPEFQKAVTQQQLNQLFRWVSTLGRLQKCEPAQGQALMSATTQNGKMTSAQYASKATFEKGEATVTLGLIKHGDQWQILRFDVRSPQLIPH
jgi:UDP-N-acetylmuramyl tripeptide synthase